MAVKYIADLHWYDAYSLEWRSKLDMTLDDFVDMCIEKWNECTSDEDIVVVAGDIGLECAKTINALRELNGRLVLVLGNHDAKWSTMNLSRVFKNTVTMLRNDNVYVKHIPDVEVPNGCYLVHGHHHAYNTVNMQKARLDYIRDTKRLNCCIDLNHYKPSTLLQLQMNKEEVHTAW